jgi:hypothetical protein
MLHNEVQTITLQEKKDYLLYKSNWNSNYVNHTDTQPSVENLNTKKFVVTYTTKEKSNNYCYVYAENEIIAKQKFLIECANNKWFVIVISCLTLKYFNDLIKDRDLFVDVLKCDIELHESHTHKQPSVEDTGIKNFIITYTKKVSKKIILLYKNF